MTSEPAIPDELDAAAFEVNSVHHFAGEQCLCGFHSARARSRTEHITGALLTELAALSAAPLEEPAMPSVNEMGEFIEDWGITNARGIGTVGSARLAEALLERFWKGSSDV